jgi:hypothetical protein
MPPVEVSEFVRPPKPAVQPEVETVAIPEKLSEPAKTPARKWSRHRASTDEFEMLRRLRAYVDEVDLNPPPKLKSLLGSVKEPKGAKETKPAAEEPSKSIEELVAKRSDLAGLPLQLGKDCQKQEKAAKRMGALSQQYRRLSVKSSRSSGLSPSEDTPGDQTIVDLLRSEACKYGGADLAVLVQMFQANSRSCRLELVKLLAASKDKEATPLLAQRALYDLDEGVREAAIAALKSRPRDEYRRILFDGLRYPWSTVADRAADALVALKDRAVVPKLVALLDQPDPAAPFQNEKGQWIVAEMVRVNHLRNCTLCHARSTSKDDPVRGVIPTPGKELPVVYYDKAKGDFVRADITYLRQDFSVFQAVEGAAPWPYFQRYDYLVRRRPATPGEVNERALAEGPANYPQREAVLYALRELTGLDIGPSSAEWKQAILREMLKSIF